jgi:Rad3-related DNA helicase
VYKNVEKPWIEDEFNHFRLYVSRNSLGSNIIGSYVVGLRCLVPWLTFKDIIRFKPRSILLTSGTLKPLPMWEKELKLKFTKQLVNKHVIKDEQISAKIIKAGPSKVRFTFTYDNLSKNRTEIFKDLIEFLVQACSQIPNGILLIFPSFKIQMDFKYELMRSSKKEKLSSFKDIIF